jgi:hypothetical protein
VYITVLKKNETLLKDLAVTPGGTDSAWLPARQHSRMPGAVDTHGLSNLISISNSSAAQWPRTCSHVAQSQSDFMSGPSCSSAAPYIKTRRVCGRQGILLGQC